MSIPWTTAISQNWPCVWLRQPDDARAAGEQFERQLWGGRAPRNDFDAAERNDEITSALLWLAGPEARQDRCPTVREICRAVWILRRRAREADAPPAEDCGQCRGSGWTTFWPRWEPGWAVERYMVEYGVGVPCLCDAGRVALERSYIRRNTSPEQVERIREMSRLAAEQWRARVGVENAENGAGSGVTP